MLSTRPTLRAAFLAVSLVVTPFIVVAQDADDQFRNCKNNALVDRTIRYADIEQDYLQILVDAYDRYKDETEQARDKDRDESARIRREARSHYQDTRHDARDEKSSQRRQARDDYKDAVDECKAERDRNEEEEENRSSARSSSSRTSLSRSSSSRSSSSRSSRTSSSRSSSSKSNSSRSSSSRSFGDMGDRCISSNDCRGSLRCSTERGVCNPYCRDPDGPCIMVCSGNCENPLIP